MKAYILTITFKDIEPAIWRKVVMPAGATFNRLHEMIQNVTNFQSEWIDEPYHFFEFVIDHEIITNNPVTLEDFKKSKRENLKFTVKSPTHTKIDKYLEKYDEILYCYDFGDGWQITIKVDEVVNDYYFGFPTVLAGEGAAPPEDVGGPPGFMGFLKVYNNKDHPDFLDTFRWAEKQYFKPFDRNQVNDRLKYQKYQKTEWDKIDHANYVVLSDKYRGPNQ
ncbi:plasmid pRiA4b ORF-3 family protein [Rummeliibacillus sp. TYF005]|uniref:plasmid pRiA4b ORF-3 family protein n=1 Tax=Rummeliibacillus sp. TYF005 TaxID=2058214 RepID=UPI000F540489|nr:plasmid pRiA4b ORF-3 family protein [Rummeliibacillus sp. TYF005]RPJ95421.1 plasmid pRiA4b ORF-3 family protein [Rummeliibacillus sp. TYF005]